MTVVVTAVFHPVEGRTAELVDALRACIPAVHDEPGCSLYAIHDAEDGTITMIEKWDSSEALAAHAAGPAVKELGDTPLRVWLGDLPVSAYGRGSEEPTTRPSWRHLQEQTLS